jgi:hypothetical protein
MNAERLGITMAELLTHGTSGRFSTPCSENFAFLHLQ